MRQAPIRRHRQRSAARALCESWTISRRASTEYVVFACVWMQVGSWTGLRLKSWKKKNILSNSRISLSIESSTNIFSACAKQTHDVCIGESQHTRRADRLVIELDNVASKLWSKKPSKKKQKPWREWCVTQRQWWRQMMTDTKIARAWVPNIVAAVAFHLAARDALKTLNWEKRKKKEKTTTTQWNPIGKQREQKLPTVRREQTTHCNVQRWFTCAPIQSPCQTPSGRQPRRPCASWRHSTRRRSSSYVACTESESKRGDRRRENRLRWSCLWAQLTRTNVAASNGANIWQARHRALNNRRNLSTTNTSTMRAMIL